MDSPESHSPPRRKRFREPPPDLATLFHGLTAVSTATVKGSARHKGKASTSGGGGGSGRREGGGAPGGVLGVNKEGVEERASETAEPQHATNTSPTLPRPPTAPLRPVAPLHHQLVTASTFDQAPLPTPLSSPLPPLTPSSLAQPDPAEPARRRLHRGRADSTVSAHWAARVLSPIVREERRERDLLRFKSSTKRRGVESAEEGDGGEMVSVDDFLAALPSKPKKVARKYGLRTLKERREKSEKRRSVRGEEEGKAAPKRAKRKALELDDDDDGNCYSPKPPKRKRKPRRRVLIDYSSDSNDERSPETEAPPRRRPRPTKRIRLARQFDVAASPAPPPPKVGKQLVLVKEWLLEGSQAELYANKVGGGREIKRVDPRKGPQGVFLSSLGDTAFGGMRGSKEVRGGRRVEGQKRVTSLVFPFAEVEELALRVGTVPAIGVKRGSRVKQAASSRYRALEMVPEEESEIGGAAAGCVFSSFVLVCRLTKDFLRRDLDELCAVPHPIDKRAHPRAQLPATVRKPFVAAPPTPTTASRPPRARIYSIIRSSATTLPAAPSTSNLQAQADKWPEKVERMEHAFRRKLRKPVVESQPEEELAIPAIEEEDNDLSSEGEHEGPQEPFDPIALLPTPAISKFRFITGIKAKIRPQLDLVPADKLSLYELSPPLSILDQVPARLAFVSEAEFDAARERDIEEDLGREELAILAGEWDANEQAGGGARIDSSLEYAAIDLSESQLRQLDALSPPSPSRQQQQPSPPPEKPLQRHVTFSSPVPSPRRLPPSTPHPIKVKRTPSRRRNSEASTCKALRQTPVRRSKTTLPTSTSRQIPSSSSGISRTTSSGAPPKILRRISLKPDFHFPGTPENVVQEVDNYGDDHATHASSHSFSQRSSISPSPLPLPPPGGQRTRGAPQPSGSQDYFEDEGPSFEERLLEAEALARAQEAELARKENTAPTNLLPPPPDPSPPHPSPIVATRVPSNPNAILSLPSSNPTARTIGRRKSTTVWKGQVLDQLGVMPLPAFC